MTDTDRESQKGVKLWSRKRFGAPPKYETPEALWDDCVKYFEWVEDNPLMADNLVTYQGVANHEEVAHMRAMTYDGLCAYIGITIRTWREWREKREDLSPVIKEVDQIIREQKFTGAASGHLNPNIIARDLGLADRQEHTGKDGGPIQQEHTEKSPEEKAKMIAFYLQKGLSNG